MQSNLTDVHMESAENALRDTIGRGVRLSVNRNELTYKSPIGAITQEEGKSLRASTSQMLLALKRVGGIRSINLETDSHSRVDYAPLAFSQLTHWNLHQLTDRKSVRVVSSAVRLIGALDTGALKTAIEMIIERHESLRTKIGIIGGSPIQIIFASGRSDMDMVDLTMLPSPLREGELQRQIWSHILEPIDPSTDALFSTKLVKLGGHEHVLIVAMDHMVSDGMSMAIVLRDIFAKYEFETLAQPSYLPEVSVQFADYAVWQRSMYKRWALEQGESRSARLAGCRILSINHDDAPKQLARSGLGYIPIRIEPKLRRELLQWCRTWRTTMAISVFTAFVALVFRWCGSSEGVIQYETSGRSVVEVQNTTGYFAFRLYLCLSLRERDTFIDLMHQIRAEYVRACEHGEFSSMDTYERRPEMARSPCFNWLISDPISSALNWGEQKGGIMCSRVPFEDQLTCLDGFRTDTELMVGFREAGDAIHGSVQFPRQLVSQETAESFGHNLMVFIGALLGRSEVPVMETELVT